MATSIRTAETDCWEGRRWEASRDTASQDEELGGIKHIPERLQMAWPTTVEYVLLIETITKIESILSHRIYLRTLRGRNYAGLLLV